MRDPTKRFSDRVENYVKYRPSYPAALFDYLAEAMGAVRPEATGGGATAGRGFAAPSPRGRGLRAADVGAGTGIFTALLAARLEREGGSVTGVEPNGDMREAALRHCAGLANATLVDGSAEATGLDTASVDLVTVAQAFHWFDRDRALAEFARIAAPGAKLALAWNNRLCDTPFLAEYDRLVSTHAGEYRDVTHRNVGRDSLLDCFAGDAIYREFAYEQRFDLAGVKGRVLSSSYCPKRGQPGHAEIMKGLEAAFARYAEDGTVAFRYRTELHFGSPAR